MPPKNSNTNDKPKKKAVPGFIREIREKNPGPVFPEAEMNEAKEKIEKINAEVQQINAQIDEAKATRGGAFDAFNAAREQSNIVKGVFEEHLAAFNQLKTQKTESLENVSFMLKDYRGLNPRSEDIIARVEQLIGEKERSIRDDQMSSAQRDRLARECEKIRRLVPSLREHLVLLKETNKVFEEMQKARKALNLQRDEVTRLKEELPQIDDTLFERRKALRKQKDELFAEKKNLYERHKATLKEHEKKIQKLIDLEKSQWHERVIKNLEASFEKREQFRMERYLKAEDSIKDKEYFQSELDDLESMITYLRSFTTVDASQPVSTTVKSVAPSGRTIMTKGNIPQRNIRKKSKRRNKQRTRGERPEVIPDFLFLFSTFKIQPPSSWDDLNRCIDDVRVKKSDFRKKIDEKRGESKEWLKTVEAEIEEDRKQDREQLDAKIKDILEKKTKAAEQQQQKTEVEVVVEETPKEEEVEQEIEVEAAEVVETVEE
ncbi:hypothetical protein PCE1_004331 [Barthelona sp. PCE]